MELLKTTKTFLKSWLRTSLELKYLEVLQVERADLLRKSLLSRPSKGESIWETTPESEKKT
jgi:hypothetical protein